MNECPLCGAEINKEKEKENVGEPMNGKNKNNGIKIKWDGK